MIGGRKAQSRLLCGAALAVLVMAGAAQAAEPLDIAPQPLSMALREFGLKTGQPVLYGPALANSKISSGVQGAPTAEAALTALLAGTGLTYKREGEAFLIVQAGEGGSPQDQGVAGGGAEVEELIVTAQKREEAIQDVPIAISAFTQRDLDAQKIEGGFDLLKAIPNVTFSKTNFSSYNFSIRGVGTKAISATTDPAVAVAFNSSHLIVNRLFEQEYFDVERVEVLRGPQGTLYGRNATSGVINVITAKPRLMEFEADLKLETGNYNARRARGMVNVPIGETLAVRVAGAVTKRDGYGVNLEDGSDVDGRDLWSLRTSVGWEPNERLRANLIWERFSEDDNRVRTSKQLCHHDPGLTEVNGEPVTIDFFGNDPQPSLSQGCLPGSLYDEGAFGTPLGRSLPFVLGANYFTTIGFNPNPDPVNCPQDAGVNLPTVATYGPLIKCRDPYASVTQSTDLRAIASIIEPHYRAAADIYALDLQFDLTEALTLISQTLYTKDEVYATQDYNRFHTQPIFNDSAAACATSQVVATPQPCNPGMYGQAGFGYYPLGFSAGGMADLTPGGVFCDPQLGCSDRLVAQDLSQATSSQFNQEFRLQSNFDGPLNFSIGSNYTRFGTDNDYFVFVNLFTLIIRSNAYMNGPGSRCDLGTATCVYIDPNPLSSINGDGHNYFRSKNPYRLTSTAAFGELYWQATDTVKVTAGLRFTWDKKIFTPHPSQTLLRDYREIDTVGEGFGPEACVQFAAPTLCGLYGTASRGYPADPPIVQSWREPTGRLVVDWKPALGFTDETMFYASYARGYKGGGANPPSIAPPQGLLSLRGREADAKATFEPEFVDAFEIGAKNTLLGGGLTLNGTAFHYDYKDYQVSKIVDRTAANENFDATIWGMELESVFSPTRNLRFNLALGYLNTRIGDGEQSIDLMDRTQGNPDWVVIKPGLTQASNCIAPAELVATVLANTGGFSAAGLDRFCPGGSTFSFTFWPGRNTSSNMPGVGRMLLPDEIPNGGAGFFADLSGNELPNAPHWTLSLGGQYRFSLPAGWDGTVRVDHYWQDESFARVYNTEYDRLRSWQNTNVSFWIENPDLGLTAEVYVKNAFDETPITDAFLNSDDSGLTTNVFTLDPRLVGLSVRKTF